MSKGFVLLALNTDTVDYRRLAYACALSIKHSQPVHNHITIYTDDVLQFKKHNNLFNLIDSIKLYKGPKGMDARSRIWDITPYEETVFLDSDMLILDEIDWSHLSNYYLYLATHAQNARGERFHYGPYRELFKTHQLPNVYNAFTYFKKSDPRTAEFFNLAKDITDYPKAFISKFLQPSLLTTLPTDEAFALTAKILDIEPEITDDKISITHMKPLVQNWRFTQDDWTSYTRLSVDETGQPSVGVWKQTGLLHYVDKNAINNNTISILEDLVCP